MTSEQIKEKIQQNTSKTLDAATFEMLGEIAFQLAKHNEFQERVHLATVESWERSTFGR